MAETIQNGKNALFSLRSLRYSFQQVWLVGSKLFQNTTHNVLAPKDAQDSDWGKVYSCI